MSDTRRIQEDHVSELTMTPKEASEQLKVSPRTIAKLCRSGALPAHRVGGRWRISAQIRDWFLRE
jgi:excisionase family DNA binding protein